jgi:hypothetical protein
MIIARYGMDLCLAAQAAKRAGEDNPVVILVKRTTPQFLGAVQGFAKTLAVEQGLPVQGVHSIDEMP